SPEVSDEWNQTQHRRGVSTLKPCTLKFTHSMKKPALTFLKEDESGLEFTSEGQRIVVAGGSGGTTVGPWPGTGREPRAGGGAEPAAAVVVPAAGGAAAVAVPGGAPPGRTTTRVPTLVRSNRSETSSFSMPMQPEETNLPMVEGWLVPWMR